MERMTPDTTDFNSLSKKQLVELVITKYNDCFRLEEENKKLNEEIQRFKDNAMQDMREITELEEENKKLKEKIKRLEFDVDAWNQLKLLLEGEIEKLKKLMESCYGLAKENEKLKSDLSECECSFGFESDEVGYRWIKDHCKGYGNLFPEDEMKRQWKKADKKRK